MTIPLVKTVKMENILPLQEQQNADHVAVDKKHQAITHPVFFVQLESIQIQAAVASDVHLTLIHHRMEHVLVALANLDLK